jgi:hypothetical protein
MAALHDPTVDCPLLARVSELIIDEDPSGYPITGKRQATQPAIYTNTGNATRDAG